MNPPCLSLRHAIAWVALSAIALPTGPNVPSPMSAAPLAWPLGPDPTVPRALYSSHGQFWKLGSEIFLHQGLDISACPRERVYAVEGGTVVYKSVAEAGPDSSNQHQEIVISRGADLLHGIRYLHLGTVLVDVGDEVARDEIIGTVVNWDYWCSYDHLHLQSLSYPDRSTSTAWLAGFAGDAGNPISLFDPKADKEVPYVHSVPSSVVSADVQILFFKDASDEELDPMALKGSIDVVAALHDRCFSVQPTCPPSSSACSDKSSFEVAPYLVALKIRGPLPDTGETALGAASVGETHFEPIRFEQEIPTGMSKLYATNCYSSSTVGQYDRRDQRFVLTHGLTSSTGSWDPDPGTYEVTVDIRDRSDNAARAVVTVTVAP